MRQVANKEIVLRTVAIHYESADRSAFRLVSDHC